MDTRKVLNILKHGNQLKRTPRTGWLMRGIANAENVAAHTYGVAFTALILVELIDEPVDMATVLAMAILHDLPEGLTTDIPSPAWRYMPAGIKTDVERQALQEILGESEIIRHLLPLWEALHAAETAEARLVDDADKLEMFVQAVMYEQQTGNAHLEEFWERPYQFNFPQAQAIYDRLREERQKGCY